MDYLSSDLNKIYKLSHSFKIFLLILFPIFAPFINFSQLNADIGFMSGISYYIGDINPSKHFYKPGTLYSGFYRYNLHKRYSVKANTSYTKIKASDSDFNNNLQRDRNYEFSSGIVDISIQIEHNFWPYSTTLIEEDRFSPYIFTGITGLYMFGDKSDIYFAIPFGAGFKINLNKRIGLGIEYSLKRSFSDDLDGSDSWNDDEYFGYTNDWYSFLGIFCSYKIFTKNLLCPAYNSN